MITERGKTAKGTSVIARILIVVGGLEILLFLGLMMGLAAGAGVKESGAASFLLLLVAGPLATGAALVALGVLIGQLQAQQVQLAEQTRLLETLASGGRLPAAGASANAAPTQASTGNPTLLSMATAAASLPSEERHGDPARIQTLELLQQIRDSALMTDAQRQDCAKAHWAKRKQATQRLVERHILSGDWSSARLRVDELRAILPDDPEVLDLSERLAGEHASRVTDDLVAARAQLRHLLSITAWQEAEEIVGSLQKKYPNDTQVGHLAADIAHEREKLERDNRERLLSELANATENRQWRRAITAAEDFIQRYPADTYSERLQFDLPTLHENAAAADRREQEQLFKDLLKRQRYEEAEGIARSLITKYPASPAAAELMRMLPRVEELNRQEKLKRPVDSASSV